MKTSLRYFFILTVIFSLSLCGKKKGPVPAMMVVFSSGQAEVVKSGKAIQATVGTQVSETDLLKTENGVMELQTAKGTMVRVHPFTIVTVSKLYGADQTRSLLIVEQGGLIARIQKTSQKENFGVASPTAIASVRGTAFELNTSTGLEDGGTTIKVYEGEVAVAPRIIGLENNQLQGKDADLAKRLIEEKTVILSENSQARLPARQEAVIQSINQSDDGGSLTESIQKLSMEKNLFEVKTATLSGLEKTKIETLVAVEGDVYENLADDPTNIKAVNRRRSELQEETLGRLESEAGKKVLTTEQAIEEYYNRIETVKLKDGSSLKGAVIAQTDEVLVVHTTSGVKRIQSDKVAEITYD